MQYRWTKLQVDLLLISTEDELAIPFPSQQANPRNPIQHSPFVRQTKHTAQNCQSAVGRCRTHLLSTRLRKFLHRRFVNLIQPAVSQKMEREQPFEASFVMSLNFIPSHSKTLQTHQSSGRGHLFRTLMLRLSREPTPKRFANRRALLAVRTSQQAPLSELKLGGYTV
jgi:hypothetical protein